MALVVMRVISVCYLGYTELRLKMVFTGEDYSVGPFKLVLGKDKGGGQRYSHVALS